MINNFDFSYEVEMQKKDAERHQLKIERDIFFRKVFKDVLSRLGVKNDNGFIIDCVDDKDVDNLFYKYIGCLASNHKQSKSINLSLIWAVEKWHLSCSPDLLKSVAKKANRSLNNGPFRLTDEIIALFHARSVAFCESESMYNF